jgi:putative ABC transport system permease protein
LIVRTSADPMALAPAVRSAIWEVDADQPVSNMRSMDNLVDADLSNRNTQLTLVGAFAVLALLLASIGLYGVLSYTVALRTSEIGLRMALGARPANVVGAVVRHALTLSAVGAVLGIGGAFAVTRLLASMLFGISPTDPITFAGVSVVIALVAIIASYVPARRAAAIDPAVALRSD